ncbi:hypothetical protein AB0M48_38985 [Lentzea sp. NPDC051208]|uniref:hypothetical protein n=1 Tax=Lentzea sp. NPDC051208 TaxID=3154642 RepID=UPI003414D919
MAWRVRTRDDGLVLPLPAGWIGVHATDDVAASARAHPVLREACGPVLAVPTGDGRRWLFLAEVDESVLSSTELPDGVGLIRPPRELLLPPSSNDFGMIRWAVCPSPEKRWLPTATTVVSALREVISPRRHVRWLRTRPVDEWYRPGTTGTTRDR